MPDNFPRNLARFEVALAERPLRYAKLLEVIRALDVPADVNADDLTRYFDCSYRILDLNETGFGEALRSDVGASAAGHLEACAGELIEHVLYDRDARNRAWIEERIAWFQERGQEAPDAYFDHDLPPALKIPWDQETAQERVRPLLSYWQAQLPDHPTGHIRLCWCVIHDGYPVFRDVFTEWMEKLEEQNLGPPGTLAAFANADELLHKAEAGHPIPWPECERETLALLDDPHPMVVAGAARYLGALYESNCFGNDPAAPNLIAMLDRLSALPQFRAIACGGFVCGFDTECSGLHALASDSRVIEAGFAIDDWILKIVTSDDYEPYLPNAQALWFYIHEYYDFEPEMVMKFIDRGRAWLALMCATEAPQAVDGMKPVLERLSTTRDAAIAEAAKGHLAAHYT